MTQPKIRKAEESEIVEVAEMAGKLTGKNIDRNLWASLFPTMVRFPDHVVLVAEVDGALVGFASATEVLTLSAGHPFLLVDMLWVEPKYRRQRIGAHLVEGCSEFGRTRGCQRIRLAGSPDAREFCSVLGVEEELLAFFGKRI